MFCDLEYFTGKSEQVKPCGDYPPDPYISLNQKVSTGINDTYVVWTAHKLSCNSISVRIGKCQNWKVSELESVRIGKCQNWKMSELESVRI